VAVADKLAEAEAAIAEPPAIELLRARKTAQ